MAAQTKPENMLPIMIVLGVMFIGICIAMNLFSRARFKKRTNAFAVTRATPSVRRQHRSGSNPGGSQRSDINTSSRAVSPLPPTTSTSTTTCAKQTQVQTSGATNGSYVIREHRVSLVKT